MVLCSPQPTSVALLGYRLLCLGGQGLPVERLLVLCFTVLAVEVVIISGRRQHAQLAGGAQGGGVGGSRGDVVTGVALHQSVGLQQLVGTLLHDTKVLHQVALCHIPLAQHVADRWRVAPNLVEDVPNTSLECVDGFHGLLMFLLVQVSLCLHLLQLLLHVLQLLLAHRVRDHTTGSVRLDLPLDGGDLVVELLDLLVELVDVVE
mmetsp:Transcript_29512/g.83249  ORF Transcript_29512/g.83249 Transcript_29512/m.83249 type:complete len:205 (-) Transcript_29512:1245-1859(-)